MKGNKKILCALAVALAVGTAVFAGCTEAPSASDENPYKGDVSYVLYAQSYEWGPGYSRMIITFDGNVDGAALTTDTFAVKASGAKRTVTDIYLSDSDGERVTGSSDTITLALRVGYNPNMLSPVESCGAFTSDPETGYSVWQEGGYTADLGEGKTITIGGVEYNSLSVGKDDYAGKICREVENLNKGVYNGEKNLSYAAYETQAMEQDGGKNALIIFLHGVGEGGTDVDGPLLAYETTNIFEDEIQQYFKKDGLEGAYGLVVQAPTNWGECGTDVLMGAITNYVLENGDIDESRIYIGGCSAGGFMTMRMLIAYPEYVAAAYPICEALSDSQISDSDIQSIKDIPMWFTHSLDDSTVVAANTVLPTYVRLVRAGAEDVKAT